jgi:hypothetical protein
MALKGGGPWNEMTVDQKTKVHSNSVRFQNTTPRATSLWLAAIAANA